jgi:uncharacterized membrane protein YdbT with pleckstrin-like domain
MRTKLREGEEKVLETRTHWITVAKPFFVFLIAVVLLVLSFFLIKERGVLRDVAVWTTAILLFAAACNFGYRELYRRRDIWAVTNLRVIDEKGVFNRYTKESPLGKINNLTYSQSLLGRILGYGEVEIQTAAEDGATIYRMVKNPLLLKDTIARCRDELNGLSSPGEKTTSCETQTCPFCAEKIKAQAKVCRYCGRGIPPAGTGAN